MRSQFISGLCVLGKGTDPLHILKYREGPKWVCHCLEYDLSGQSTASQEAAFIEMRRTIEEFFDRTRLQALRPQHAAPPELWQAWNSATAPSSTARTRHKDS